MAVARNADDYAAGRQGIFFPAHNSTSADGNLTGQCVTLIKWFMSEMTSVPNPFAARGHARYVGDTLVAQGHAVEVPYSERRRGDIAVYKYGTYGHILLVLSGDRAFEQNANVGGVARRLVDGAYVYASRIGSLRESWRSPVPNIYRIKTYSEGEDSVKVQNAENWYGRLNKLHWQVRGRELDRGTFQSFVGMDTLTVIEIFSDSPESDIVQNWQSVGKTAVQDKWDQQIYAQIARGNAAEKALGEANAVVADLTKKLQEMGSRPTTAEFAEIKKKLEDANSVITQSQADIEAAKQRVKELELEKQQADIAGNAITRWVKEQINAIINKFAGVK